MVKKIKLYFFLKKIKINFLLFCNKKKLKKKNMDKSEENKENKDYIIVIHVNSYLNSIYKVLDDSLFGNIYKLDFIEMKKDLMFLLAIM